MTILRLSIALLALTMSCTAVVDSESPEEVPDAKEETAPSETSVVPLTDSSETFDTADAGPDTEERNDATADAPIADAAPETSTDAGSVENAEMVVTKITRLTAPEYNVGQIHYGVREPWNSDRTRIMYHEYGTGEVWGRLDALQSWKSPAEYLAARKPVHPKNEFAQFIWWSERVTEPSVVYALHKPSKNFVRYNVDTGVMETIVSYAPSGGGDVSAARLMGWTTDGTMICNLEGEVWARGAWEIDVIKKTRVFHSNARYGDGSAANKKRWPTLSHGHGGPSPDRTLYASYGDREITKWPSGELVRKLPGSYLEPKVSMNHLSWKASDKWWVADDVGINYYARVLAGTWPFTAPHVDTFGISQCRTDGTCKRLLQTKTASYWEDSGFKVWNYDSHPIVTLRRDGRQLVFTSTDGKYSKTDNARRGVTPWGNAGLFIADLKPL